MNDLIREDALRSPARYLIQAAMKITDEIETYFLSFTLVHGIDSTPLPATEGQAYQRYQLHVLISAAMMRWDHKPDFLRKLRRAYNEVGTTNESWFFGQLAEAYLQWLYSPRSKNTPAEAAP